MNKNLDFLTGFHKAALPVALSPDGARVFVLRLHSLSSVVTTNRLWFCFMTIVPVAVFLKQAIYEQFVANFFRFMGRQESIESKGPNHHLFWNKKNFPFSNFQVQNWEIETVWEPFVWFVCSIRWCNNKKSDRPV